MFRRINSNIDPDATVAKEVRKEFAKYFDKAEERRNILLKAYPKQIFIGMVVLIILSGIVCFVILTPSHRQQQKMPSFSTGAADVTGNVTGGIGQIIDLGTRISDLAELRKQVEETLKKPKLTHADTVFLEKAIQQLQHSNKPLNSQKR